MTLASALVCAALAAQPALRPKTAEPLVPPPQKAPEGVPQAPAPAAAPPADEIPVAGADAGAVRVPSSPDAWGGMRTGQEPTLSQRVADYRLEAVLDPVKHTVDGKEQLTWRNRSARTVRSLYFHLYLNAFEGPGSTFLAENARYGGFRSGVKDKKGEWGWIELRKLQQGGRDLKWQYVHPDGGSESDHTVIRVELAEPVPAGGTAVLDIDFFDQLPRVVARTGYFGNFHLVAQWFPKVGVLELPGERGATGPRWNCHELHLYSEFYADFGTYDATIVAPKGYVVGAVGEEQGPPRDTPEGLAHRFVQGDVHDFAFAASDSFRELTGSYEGPGGPHVAVRVLYPAEYEASARSTLEATVDSLGYFSRTLGPYPYRTSTAIVPPYNAIEAGGMEYETFFTSAGYSADPLLQFTRFVAIHEFGHGYFMGILASNEAEEPVLDEGLDEFWDSRMMAEKPVPVRVPALSRLGFPTLIGDWWDYERLFGTSRFPADPIGGNSWARYSGASYGLVYQRTSMVFHDLGSIIGEEVLARAMKEYYRRWRFRHPSTADLRAVFEEVSGRKDAIDRWFEEQVYAAQPVDDRVETVDSAEALPQPGTEVRGGQRVELDEKAVQKEIREKRAAFEKEHGKPRPGQPGPFPWRTVVQARRYAAHVPQTLVVKFADGTAETLPWPEDERWHRWVLERPVPAESAQIDPQRAWFLDVNKLDDGRSREAHPLAARRWTLEAAAWLQTLLAFVEAL